MQARPARVLPPRLLERARAFAEARGSSAGGRHGDPEVPAPVTPRPAATVVLLRDGDDGGAGGQGLEAFVLRRTGSMRFAAGMHVFPGGTVDPRDLEHRVTWSGEPPERWASAFSVDVSLASALVCAAVRETFEESGVLLAAPSADSAVIDAGSAEWEADREALVGHELGLADLLGSRGLVLRADLLRPWAHWITPEFEERRYDTRFFVAPLPPGRRPRDVGGEADRVAWVGVREAVARHERGEMAMLPPTVTTLGELAEYGTVADVLAAGWARQVVPMMPRPLVRGDEVHLVLPGEPGYDEAVSTGEATGGAS